MDEPGASLRIASFVSEASPPGEARIWAVQAFVDTVGVALAGASEPAARSVQRLIAEENGAARESGPCSVLGTTVRAAAGAAALANGTAAHALDYDDMCFVSLAHPSAPLCAATLAIAELVGAPGRALLDAYVVGFEVEARLGRRMNPRHYRRGWHCTSTIGSIGAAAAASRLLALSPQATLHALGIAASEASGLKENFGSMVKPLHAGLAARNGVHAALLARCGMSASESALAGAQGFFNAMDAEERELDEAALDLGSRWEILQTGIAVKLYPSCAATHPALDALLDLRREQRYGAADVEAIEIDVDSITPTVLVYQRPTTGLQAKFSMPFCAAAAVLYGSIGIDTFAEGKLRDPALLALMGRVSMRVDRELDHAAAPLTRARICVALRDGRKLTRAVRGARGDFEQPPSGAELDAKFIDCAGRVLSADSAQRALAHLRALDSAGDLRAVLRTLQPASGEV